MARKKVEVLDVAPPKTVAKKALTKEVTARLEQLAKQVAQPIANDQQQQDVEAAQLWAHERIKFHEALMGPIIAKTKEAYDTARAQLATLNKPFLLIKQSAVTSIGNYLTDKERERRRLLTSAPRPAFLSVAAPSPIPTDTGLIEDDIPTAPAQAPAAPPPVMPVIATPPAESSLATREDWFFTVTDPMAIIKAVAEGALPADVIIINQSRLNEYADELKELMRTWPGGTVDFKKVPISTRRG